MAGTMVENGTTLKMNFIAGTTTRTSTSQYKVAYLSASMTVNLATAAADEVVGIICSMQSANSEYVTVITHGLAKGVMVTDTACVIGAWLVADSIGTLDTGDTVTTDNIIIGRALSVPVTGGAVLVYVNPQPTVLD